MKRSSLKSYLFEISGEAVQRAKQSCAGGLPDAENCAWYHGAWPALRALDMVSNPYWHFQFFKKHIENAVRAGHARKVLVLGCADVSTASLVSECCSLPVLVTDKCASPLHWADARAVDRGLDWTTAQLDITESVPAGTFDIIINDAFLTRFPDEEKQQILTRIASVLGPESVYLTSVRVADGIERQAAAYKSKRDRRTWFVERANAKFAEVGGLQGISAQDFNELVEGYMRSMVSFRFDDERHIDEVFSAAGLALVESEFVVVPGESEESSYVRIAARPKR